MRSRDLGLRRTARIVLPAASMNVVRPNLRSLKASPLLIASMLVAAAACSSTTETATPSGVDRSQSADGGAGASDGGPSVTGDDALAPQTDAGQKAGADGGSCTLETFYADTDGDGYGDSKTAILACTPPSGYVADKTDCDDKNAAVHPKATEVCNLIDDDCDGVVDGPMCGSFAHAYAGTYTMHTTEKLGTSVLHDVTCTGTSALSVDLTRSAVVKGTVTCTYTGGVTLFAGTQTGVIEATVQPDGTVAGKLTHDFNPLEGNARTFTFTGAITNGKLAIDRTGASWLPNPMSAQAWDVDFHVAAQ